MAKEKSEPAMKLRLTTALSVLTVALAVCACTGERAQRKSAAAQSNRPDAVALVESFVTEFYTERVGNLTAFIAKYTDWPDFGPGDSVTVASHYSIRKLMQTDKNAEVEVTFKVVGEESLGKLDSNEREEIQVYRLEKRHDAWRIVEPIHLPCVSVEAEVKTLRDLAESAAARLQQADFTPQEPEDYFRSLREHAETSLATLARYQ